jgi:hypothetical protein
VGALAPCGGEIENAGVIVQFYLVKIGLNTEAERLAKEAAGCGTQSSSCVSEIMHSLFTDRKRVKQRSMFSTLSTACFLATGHLLG